MHRRTWLLVGLVLLVVALSLGTVTAAAQTGGPFDLSWNCVGCSGGVSSGGSYVLFGSTGQPAVGQVMTGGSYALEGGFLAYGNDATIYLPPTLGR